MLQRLLPCVLGFSLLSACGAKGTGSTSPGATDDPVLVKKASLGWGIQAVGDRADVYLAVTDENGRATSHSLGRFDGECAVLESGRASTGAITALLCKRGDVGVELDAIPRPGVIIVLRMGYAAGSDPDPLAGDEIAHIEVPVGAKIEVAN